MNEVLSISTGETILFVVFGVAMVVATIYGLLITRKAVYTTISIIFAMVCLAFLYTALEAPFMGMAQVVVYTGAILMMFLFVLMLVGVDSADSAHETLKAQKPVAVIGGLGIAAILAAVVLGLVGTTFNRDPLETGADLFPIGLAEANAGGNPAAVSGLIFSIWVLTLQITGCLLIVAALGAMTLTHRDRVSKRKTQADIANDKMRDFVENGVHPGHKPNAGVYAESNSSVNPALTYGGKPVEESINRVLKIRGQGRSVAEASPGAVDILTSGPGLHGPSTYGAVGRSHIAGMPGISAPDYDAAAERFELEGVDEKRSVESPSAAEVQAAEETAEALTDKNEENN